MLSEYSQGLRILPPNMAAQVNGVFRDMKFVMVFEVLFSENFILKNSQFEIPSPSNGFCDSTLINSKSCKCDCFLL